jgi:beta-phosphoglucomutase family hydrolase
MLGLPDGIACTLFDMDGVITQTAVVHDAAWKEAFDDFLRKHADQTGERFVPFDPVHDYDDYVDGKPRLDGTRSFLESRGITVPEGTPDDASGKPTLYGISNLKQELLLAKLESDGVQVYDGSVRYLNAARAAGLKTAIVSSSANTQQVLHAAGLQDAFDVRIDAQAAATQHLRGKPAPDTYLAAARALGISADHAAVFEDALAGVEAGRAGSFGYVVGVDRVGQADALRSHGADVVVSDLGELL